MGQNVEDKSYRARDFRGFERKLEQETRLLQHWIDTNQVDQQHFKLGFELELWILDRDLHPAPVISEFLADSQEPQMVSELAAYNLELNGDPVDIGPNSASDFHLALENAWRKARQRAGDTGTRVMMIGTLPNLEPDQLDLKYMSPLPRYRALNQQVMRMRKGRPLEIDIQGEERLHIQTSDVMFESACTSTQLHIQIPGRLAQRAYNAAKMLSGPMVAISANSPVAFGKVLWDETRIPLFEQSIDVGASDLTRRVTFGIKYADQGIFEPFEANLKRYPVLLPADLGGPPERLHHLSLHNGTIWRWNRALVGFDAAGAPHLRIEHRVIPSGPTVLDTVANAMLFFGTLKALLEVDGLENRLPFKLAKDNFYKAARHSIGAELHWLDHRNYRADQLVLERLLPLAEQGLNELGIRDGEKYLQIIERRASLRINGAIWQKNYMQNCRSDVQKMLQAYGALQDEGKPVHEWRTA